MDQQELIYRLSIFEQQAQQIQQQLQAIEQGVLELKTLEMGLDELRGKKDREIMSPIGRGIFAKSRLISEELIVDVGNKNFVKKSIPDTKILIHEQIEKLEEIKTQLDFSMKEMNNELEKLVSEVNLEKK